MQADTSPEADTIRIAALSNMAAAERLQMAIELSEAVRALVAAGREDRSRIAGAPVEAHQL